ncbi:MAG: DUF4129 domain-containing protein [Actinomycetota bacterium]
MSPREATRRTAVAAVLVGAAIATGVGPVGAQQEQPPVPASTPDELRESADEVLSRAEFDRPEPTILERIRNWLSDRIDEAIQSLTGGGAGTVVGWIVLVLAIAALVWAVVKLSRTVSSDPAVEAAEIRIDQGRTPAEWQGEAARLEAAGRWKEALRCRYRALLGDLVRAGVLEDVPGRTTGEYRREVDDGLTGASDAFGEATELFELAWYADVPTAEAESARFRELATDVVATASDPRAGRRLAGAAP